MGYFLMIVKLGYERLGSRAGVAGAQLRALA
jgi:hypothetical protein